jgi:microcompartment protein CcmK/EutM
VILARIAGSVVSTIHHPIVNGRKLLLAERLDSNGEPMGGYVIAMDVVGAGHGEAVLIIDEGNGARQVLKEDAAPIRAVVVGVVDGLEIVTD